MFIPKLNSKCVFKYPFDRSKKLPLAECFEKSKIADLFVCIAAADSISIGVSPTKGSQMTKTCIMRELRCYSLLGNTFLF